MSDPVFFKPARALRLAEVAGIVGGKVVTGDPEAEILRVAPLDQAGPGDLTFFDNPRYLARFKETTASACICSDKHASAAPAGSGCAPRHRRSLER